jgi:hypothetical protein
VRGRLLLLGVVAALLVSATAAHARPLQTAVFDPILFPGDGAAVGFDRTRAAGAGAVRILVPWASVAPQNRHARFDPANPFEPAYKWEAVDRQVKAAVARGLQPVLCIASAPLWAQPRAPAAGHGPFRPDPAQLARFARAAADRYSGAHEGLPRVRHWQVWNEPNLHIFLSPQFEGRTPVSPALYRRMVNEMGAAVRAVRADNLVIAGGTAPFRDLGVTHTNWGPLGFMRELLCLDRQLRRKCAQRVRFDIWAHHPYTSGGPTRRAVLPDDVSLGDLGDMRRVLQAGVRAGTVVSRGQPRFWVTEFSWDTSPPDPGGVPARLHARWTAEALYRMWTHGVSLVTWFLLRDQPFASSPYQSGLYYRGATLQRDRPKPALQAFRFPFVAFPQHAQGRVHVWGRTPAGRRARVLVEQQFQGGWKRLGIVQANANGVFQARFATHRTGFVRARTVDRAERAVPFSLARVPDRTFRPFGAGQGTVEPGR